MSIGGGLQAVWSHDSRELFYRNTDGMMMAATIADGATPQVSDRTPLFSTVTYRTGTNTPRYYHIAPDGRFLMLRRPRFEGDGDGASPEITVVLNWFEELKARVPVR